MKRRARMAAFVASLCVLAGLTGCGSVKDSESAANKSPSSGGGAADITSTVDISTGLTPASTATVDGDKVSIDVGDGKTVTLDKSKPLRVAYLTQGTANTYMTSSNDAATAAAKEYGIDLTMFDGKFDPANQHAQLQNILSGGQYDAIIGYMLDTNGECEALSKTAPDNNILVMINTNPMCGREVNSGAELYTPGTLSFVGGDGTVDFYGQWAQAISDKITEPTEMAVIGGPKILTATQAATDALEKAAAGNPNMELVATVYTDNSTQQAQAAAQNALTAHPDLGAIITSFTGITDGVVAALGRANKDIRLFDCGGDAKDVDRIKSGQLELSAVYNPAAAAASAVAALNAAWKGESVPRVILNQGVAGLDNSAQETVIITKDNVDSFTPHF